MLKGHTKIELKNEKTGEVQVVEKDNMITNVLNKQLTLIPLLNSISNINSEYFPLNTNGMGGIVLFQETLSDDLINIPDEKDNPIIGYASNDVNTETDTKRGSRNLTESVKLDNGYKFVWDFTTSQANGQISALGLTHEGAGKNPKGTDIFGLYIKQDIASDKETHQYLNSAISFDWDNSIITCIRTTSTSQVTIRKYKIVCGLTPLGINETLYSLKLVSEEAIDIEGIINEQTVWVDNSSNNYLYGIYLNSKTGNIVRINKETYKLDTSYNLSISMSSYNYYIYNSADKLPIVIVGDMLYIYLNNALATINIVTGDANETFVELNGSRSNTISLVYRGGLIHANNFYLNKDLNITRRKSTSLNHSEDFFSKGNEGAMGYEVIFIRDDGVGISITGQNNYSTLVIGNLRDYLATINNLDSPVVKTSEQSMKITYTITEVEDK